METEPTEVNVLLKCLSCGTFLTSPSFPIIKKHFIKCQNKSIASCATGNNPGDDDLFDADFEEFIDEQTETFTFTQPSLVLERCKLANLSELKNTSESAKKWFSCNVCSSRCKTEESLELHKQSIHLKLDKTFTCPICTRKIKHRRGIAGFQDHLYRHEKAESAEKINSWKQWPNQQNKIGHSTKFSCKHCLRMHSDYTDFLSHVTTEHGDKGTHSIFHCPYSCSTEVDTIKELIAHFKLNHRKIYFGNATKSDEFILNKNGNKKWIRKQKCEHCGKFFDIKYIATHKANFHSNKHVTVDSDSYTCAYPDCGQKCKTVSLLKRHFILHLEKNPYACNVPGCNIKCDAPCHLRQHFKLRHFEAPKICPKCRVTYRRTQITKHNCQANINKVQSGNFKLVKIEGFWKLKHISSNKESKLVNSKFNPKLISTSKLDKNDPNDEIAQYIKGLKGIDINTIIVSDPGFIQSCKDSPGFGQLILGNQYLSPCLNPKSTTPPCEICGRVLSNVRNRRRHMQLVHGITVPVIAGKQKKSEKVRIKKEKETTEDDGDSDVDEFPQNDEKVIVQVKIEPELTIVPDVIEKYDDFKHYDEIGKQEQN